MIKQIDLGGKIVTAVILDNDIDFNPEMYRDSILSVCKAALENQEALDNRSLTGTEVSDCLKLASALESYNITNIKQ